MSRIEELGGYRAMMRAGCRSLRPGGALREGRQDASVSSHLLVVIERWLGGHSIPANTSAELHSRTHDSPKPSTIAASMVWPRTSR